MLWSATKDGKSLYLLGTMHLGVDAEARSPDVVWKQLDAAPAFAMETDLNGPAAAAMEDDAKRKSGTLHEELGSAYWQKLEVALTPPIAEQLDGMKPFVPVEFLSMKGLPPTPPMDLVLRSHAEAGHKQLVFLEDLTVQTKAIEKWLDRKALVELLDDLDGTVQRQQEMLAAYLAGNDAKLLALNDNERASALAHGYSAAEYDTELKEMLFDRNASWIAPLEKLHAGGGGFVLAVERALHLRRDPIASWISCRKMASRSNASSRDGRHSTRGLGRVE